MNTSRPITSLATGFALAGVASSATIKTTTLSGFDELDRPIPGQPFVDFDLGPTSTTALWDGLSSDDHTGYPGFPGGTWPAPMNPNRGNSTATLEQVASGSGGTPYPSSSSLYFGGMSLGDLDGGTVRAYDPSPVANVTTVAFQIQIGDAVSWTFHQDQMPTLGYTTASGTIGALEADFESLFGYVSSPGFEAFGDVGVRTLGFQWDLSEKLEEITEVWVTMNPVQHAQIYGMQLDQSSSPQATSLLPVAIPEPSPVILSFGTLLGFFLRRRR